MSNRSFSARHQFATFSLVSAAIVVCFYVALFKNNDSKPSLRPVQMELASALPAPPMFSMGSTLPTSPLNLPLNLAAVPAPPQLGSIPPPPALGSIPAPPKPPGLPSALTIPRAPTVAGPPPAVAAKLSDVSSRVNMPPAWAQELFLNMPTPASHAIFYGFDKNNFTIPETYLTIPTAQEKVIPDGVDLTSIIAPSNPLLPTTSYVPPPPPAFPADLLTPTDLVPPPPPVLPALVPPSMSSIPPATLYGDSPFASLFPIVAPAAPVSSLPVLPSSALPLLSPAVTTDPTLIAPVTTTTKVKDTTLPLTSVTSVKETLATSKELGNNQLKVVEASTLAPKDKIQALHSVNPVQDAKAQVEEMKAGTNPDSNNRFTKFLNDKSKGESWVVEKTAKQEEKAMKFDEKDYEQEIRKEEREERHIQHALEEEEEKNSKSNDKNEEKGEKKN